MLDTMLDQTLQTATDVDHAEKLALQNNLRFLCEKRLGMRDWDSCHDGLASFLKTSKKRFKLILMPRGHLKSSIVTIGWTIQKILNDPDTTILLSNAVWNKARSFLSEIKEYLETKSTLPDLFGKFEKDKDWNSDSITIRQRERANKTPTIDTAGIEKSTTGHHYKIMIHDDLVDRQNVGSYEQRLKTWKFYSDSLDLLEPTGEMIIIGTRWDDGDLYGDIIKKEFEKFDIYEIQATTNGKVNGPVIFPKKFNTDILKELLKSKGSFEFYSQYFNSITSPETRIFNPPVRYWQVNDIDFIRPAITFDPATSGSKESCDAVVMTSGINGSNQLCVLGYTIFREGEKKPVNMINKIFDYMNRYNVKDVIVETNGGQQVYVNLLQDEAKKRKVPINVIEVHQHKSKESRILALQPYWERGDLLLKPGMIELESQFDRFRIPIIGLVDVIDALAMRIQDDIPMSISQSTQTLHNTKSSYGWINGAYIPPNPNQILQNEYQELIPGGR